MIITRTLMGLAIGLALAGCERAETPTPATQAPVAATPAPAAPEPVLPRASARVTLESVGDSGAGGELKFDEVDGALHVSGTLTGLDPGATHAFHVHETGDCSAPDASSAGGHFNPDEAPHGSRASDGPHHAGDMPNQTADDGGNATVDQRLEGLEIASGGEHDIVGKAVIVHAQADDYATQPTGNAGARIACGVVELVQPAPDYQGPAS